MDGELTQETRAPGIARYGHDPVLLCAAAHNLPKSTTGDKVGTMEPGSSHSCSVTFPDCHHRRFNRLPRTKKHWIGSVSAL